MHLRKRVNTLIDDFFSLLVNPRKQNIILNCLRIGLRLHPFLYILYHYRAGRLSMALSLADRWAPKDAFQERVWSRILEMTYIQRHGWNTTEPQYPSGASFNGKVIMALHNSLPYDWAGYAIRSHQIIANLQAMGLDVAPVTRPGYPWDLIKHSDKPFHPESIVDNICYRRLVDDRCSIGGLESEYIQGYGRLLADVAKQSGAQLIHAASNYLDGLAAAQAARTIDGVCIFEMRGLWHVSRGIKDPGYEGTDHYKYCETLELAAAREAHAVLTLSEALKDYLISEGIEEHKITVVPNAVDPDHFKPMPVNSELKEQLGLKGRTVVGFIGSLTHYEGLDLMIEAVSRLIQEGMNLSLLIVGDGYAGQDLRRWAASLPHKEHIHFTGYVPFQEVRDYYSIIDIFPFPRKRCKVCSLVPPLKVLEVMAMSHAVVISDLAPLREMVEHENTGLICRADDLHSLMEMIRLLALSPEKRQTLGQAARDWVRDNRSWKKVASKYLDLYSTLLECPQGRLLAGP